MTRPDAAATEPSHLQELAEAVQEVFWLVNAANTEMLYISPAYERIFGRSRTALWRDIHDWTNALHPDDRGKMIAFSAIADKTVRERSSASFAPTARSVCSRSACSRCARETRSSGSPA
jgi:PAS domain-containing protein